MKELSIEDKELLLKDLSQRLPYKVKCNVYDRIGVLTGLNDYGAEIDYGNGEDTTCEIKYCLPYLRSMSSMTKEENEEFEKLFIGYSISQDRNCIYHASRGDLNLGIIDWLNEHHFDYRTDDEGKTMIESGFALEAPKGMYNLKNK